MLRTNLATRPFYNLRAVQVTVALLVAFVLLVTLFNAIQILRLGAAQRTLGASAAAAEDEAMRLRNEAAGIRAKINPQELRAVANAAREANQIIDQRSFSWTELFAQFEATLPANVRITQVQPRLEQDGRFVIGMTVEARECDDLDQFMESLEAKAGFRDVLAVQDQTSDEGTIEALVEGVYAPKPREVPPVSGAGQ